MWRNPSVSLVSACLSPSEPAPRSAAGLFSGVGLWVAAAIGAIVAPTDAALGASIMEDERVPAGVRRVLNVESGLNDGIATPFVNLFLAGAATAEAVHGASSVASAALDLLGGAGIGIGVGLVGAVLLTQARKRHWSEPSFRPLAVLALALFAYSASVLAGTNGFVAAFVGWHGLRHRVRSRNGNEPLEFSDEAGTLMSLLVWFVFGAVMLVPGLDGATWRDVVFAVLALTVVRMVPVALSLVGAGLDRSTVAFVGWFGPRGLASVVFGLDRRRHPCPDGGQGRPGRCDGDRCAERAPARCDRLAAGRPLRQGRGAPAPRGPRACERPSHHHPLAPARAGFALNSDGLLAGRVGPARCSDRFHLQRSR